LLEVGIFNFGIEHFNQITFQAAIYALIYFDLPLLSNSISAVFYVGSATDACLL